MVEQVVVVGGKSILAIVGFVEEVRGHWDVIAAAWFLKRLACFLLAITLILVIVMNGSWRNNLRARLVFKSFSSARRRHT